MNKNISSDWDIQSTLEKKNVVIGLSCFVPDFKEHLFQCDVFHDDLSINRMRYKISNLG